MSGPGYRVRGPSLRPSVVFLHGFMGSSADWSGTMDTFGDAYRCVAVDLPGHGASVGLPYPDAYTMEGASRRTLEVLDGLGVGASIFVGYSMGGRLALYLALRHPERCTALVLESASPGLEEAAERARRRAADEERARRLVGDFEGFLRDWYRQPLFAPLAGDEGLLQRTIEARLRNDPAELARSLRGMGTGEQPPLWGELKRLAVPTLAVAGELDEKYVAISKRMAAQSPCIHPRVVSGAGHNVRLEAPEAYLASMRPFLQTP